MAEFHCSVLILFLFLLVVFVALDSMILYLLVLIVFNSSIRQAKKQWQACLANLIRRTTVLSSQALYSLSYGRRRGS